MVASARAAAALGGLKLMTQRSAWHVKDGFNLVAPLYDLTAQLCFAGAILRAQRSLEQALGGARRALMIGGGAGAQLQGLLERSSELQVVYLEASSKMISLAQRRLSAEQRARVTWLHDTHERLYEEPSLLSSVDVVVTSFFMDVLSPNEARALIALMTQELQRGARERSEARAAGPMWLLTDFAPHRGWRGQLVRLMYVAFKLLTGLHNQRLIDYPAAAQRQGWQLQQQAHFALGMIYAAQLSLPNSSSDIF